MSIWGGSFVSMNLPFLLKSVWNEEFTPESLADMLQKEYEISGTQALEDSKALCKSLKDNGIAE